MRHADRAAHCATVHVLAAASLVLSACTSVIVKEPPPTRSSPPTTQPSAWGSPDPNDRSSRAEAWARLFAVSRNATDAPAEIRDGAGRISCGEIVLNRGQEVPGSARACFETHIGSTAAELAVVRQTVEGDPIVRFYLTSRGLDGYDVVTNTRWDKFGDRGWSVARCAGTTTFNEASGSCRQR